MVQGGDPTNTGKGGESIFGKYFADELTDSLKVSCACQHHTLVCPFLSIRVQFNARGILGMASRGANTNGSQFFITYQKQLHLNMRYTIFGK